MIDYSNSLIFFVQSGNQIIFGATTMTLAQRKTTYKTACEQGRLKDLYLKQCLVDSNYNLHLVKIVSCRDKKELNKCIRRCKKEFLKNRKSEKILVFSLTD